MPIANNVISDCQRAEVLENTAENRSTSPFCDSLELDVLNVGRDSAWFIVHVPTVHF